MDKILSLFLCCTVAAALVSCRNGQELLTAVEEQSSVAGIYGEGEPEDNFIAGNVVVKVTPEFASQLEALTDENGLVCQKSVKSLEVPAAELGIIRMERLFPYAGEFEPRTRESGLHLWYKIAYDPSVSVTKAGTDLSVIPGITFVEYLPKIEPTGGNEVIAYDDDVYTTKAGGSSMPFDDPRLPKQWHYYNDGTMDGASGGCDINVFPVWKSYTTGKNTVIVSVVDGGIDFEHEDLAANMWHNPEKTGKNQYGYNFCANSYLITAYDHGTHVAGTIAAVNNNGIGVCGVAGGNAAMGVEGVKLMSCQIFSNNQGQGSGEAAIKWGADHGAVISQNSWGYTKATTCPPTLKAAVDYFNKYAGFDANGKQVGPMAGGVVIFAAGNENVNYSSGDYEGMVSVSSVGANYRRAYYSCYGDWCDIAAPGGDVKAGNSILSTLPGNKYGTMQGTSMACPHVSGVAALIISRFGGQGFTSASLKSKLLNNVTDISSFNRNYPMGSGLVNAYKAIAGAGGKAPSAVTSISATASSNNVTVTVNVPSDQDDGKPNSIIIYYSTEDFTSVSKAMFASFYVGEHEVGDQLSGVISGLDFNSTYYLAAKACDLAGNMSALSRKITVETGENHAPQLKLLSAGTDVTLRPHETVSVDFEATDPDGHFMYLDLLKENEDAEILDTMIVRTSPKVKIIGANAPTGSYTSKLTVSDYYGASVSVDVNYTILENHPPYIVKPMADLAYSKKGQTIELKQEDYFADDDGEQLTYSIENSSESVVNVNYSKGIFYVTSMGWGYADVRIIGTDVRGEKAEQNFRVLVRDGQEAYDIYPNPVVTEFFIRTSSEVQASYSIYTSGGGLVTTKACVISPFEPAKVDMTKCAPGVYRVVIDSELGNISRTIVKI